MMVGPDNLDMGSGGGQDWLGGPSDVFPSKKRDRAEYLEKRSKDERKRGLEVNRG